MSLPTRKLGRSGLDVTVLGFGAAPLGDIYEVLDDATAIATVEAAAAAGVTLFDAAPLYGQGSAEHRVGTALRRRPPGSFVMSTKVGRLLTPAPAGRTKTTRYVGGLSFNVVHDYSYDGAMRSHEQSLHRLGLPKVDILLIHDADAWSHGPEEGPKRYREAMSGAYKALEKLRSEKVIKAIGIGVNDPVYAARYLREGDFDCLLLAGRYTLLEQPALQRGAAASRAEERRRDAGRRVQLGDSRPRSRRRRQVQLRGCAARDPGSRAAASSRVRRPRRAAAGRGHALRAGGPRRLEPRPRRRHPRRGQAQRRGDLGNGARRPVGRPQVGGPARSVRADARLAR